MADVEDIMAVLASVVTGALYPEGTGSGPVTGFETHVFPGWPVPSALDTAIAALKVQVSVYVDAQEAATTRYLPEWRELSREVSSLVVVVSGSTITLSGIPSPGSIGIRVGRTLDFMYPVQLNDTLSSAAAGLAALISATVPATSAGPVITVSTTLPMVALASVPGRMAREVARQARDFMISVWAPTPDARRLTGKAIQEKLSGMLSLALGDGSVGRMTYKRTRVSDEMETAAIYRRDVVFTIEYPTLEIRDAYEVATAQVVIAAP